MIHMFTFLSYKYLYSRKSTYFYIEFYDLVLYYPAGIVGMANREQINIVVLVLLITTNTPVGKYEPD